MKKIIIAILVGLLLSCSNNSNKFKNGIEETVNDLEQESKDSLTQERIKFLSDSLYEIDGERIFGNFFFGMTKNEFKKQIELLNKETQGIISIKGYEYMINEEKCLFYSNQLYLVELVSTFPDYLIDFELSHEEKMGRIKDSEKTLLELFEDKYGKAHDEHGWHFIHKDISVSYAPKDPFAEDMEQFRWASFIRISKPILKKQADDEIMKERLKEEQAKAKKDSLEKEKRNDIRNKRAAASEGI